MNPFKYGTIVDGEYFTDREQETQYILQQIDSPNHLILISPRRFGKTSLVSRVATMTDRPVIYINLQKATDTVDLAAMLLKALFKLRPLESLKYHLQNFRVVPTVTTDALSNNIEVSFRPTTDATAILEDAFGLIEASGDPRRRTIVVLDEFQEIASLERGTDKRLRAIMQQQSNINYIILGSQESMMTEIFEQKRSPFYHFGSLMHLSKIPHDDFLRYIANRMPKMCNTRTIAEAILQVTDCHPYYTQQLSSQVWNLLTYGEANESDAVERAIEQLIRIHDLDFERLWLRFNTTDRKVVQLLSLSRRLSDVTTLHSSTAYSAVQRLIKAGYVIRTDEYQLEDPFFSRWVREHMV